MATNLLDSNEYKGIPDPWLDMASLFLPNNMTNILTLCERVWLKNPTMKMAAGRIGRYFITDITSSGTKGSTSSESDLVDFLKGSFRINDRLAEQMDDFLCYGNSLSTLFTPFIRQLICPTCGSTYNPRNDTDWEYKDMQFFKACTKQGCKKNGKKQPFKFADYKDRDQSRLHIIRWSPHEMKIDYHFISGERRYTWVIPQKLRVAVNSGDQYTINGMPKIFLQAIYQSENIVFKPGKVKHMCENTLSGIPTGGWGISRIFGNFAQAYYCQMLAKANEVLASDYILPFRALTPASSGGPQGDLFINSDAGTFVSNVTSMLEDHRRHPGGFHIIPTPMQQTNLGGEGATMVTHELLNQGTDLLLNGIGIPAELYRGTLQFQALPTALRMLQQTWPNLVSNCNEFLEWVTEGICLHMEWTKPESVGLKPVTIADDAEYRHLLLQLASAKIISKDTSLGSLGIDAKRESEKTLAEQEEETRQIMESEEDMAQRGQNKDYVASGGTQSQQTGAGQGGGGIGAPMGDLGAPSGGGGSDPTQIMAQALQIAQQLAPLPYEARRSELANIQKSDELMHAAVTRQLEVVNNQARTQGKQMVMQGGGM